MTQKVKPLTDHDSDPDDEDLDFFPGNMAGTGNSSPYIKDEPEEYLPPNFAQSQRTYSLPQYQDNAANSVDPNELSLQNGSFGQYGINSQQHSFITGNSSIGDDELINLEFQPQNHFQGGHNGFDAHENGNMHTIYSDLGHTGSVPVHGQNPMNQIYHSSRNVTPLSPYNNNGGFFPQVGSHPQQIHTNRASPTVRPSLGNTHGMENHYTNARPRPSLPQNMGRQASDSRSPITPKTPGLNGLSLGTPDSETAPTQPIHTNNFTQYRHQKSSSHQWDSTPGSMHSYVDGLDSPVSSPGHHPHIQISEIIKSGKHASLPAKVESSHHPVPGYQTQEAKRRRRRESHNMVERRRRDNINERIQELSHLVPSHRLEDEKVRKHMANSSPLSPALTATGRSPPQATSLLAGGGRRATGAGSISMGIPVEEKDKGPNKGDILNGAVSWTRDLMWALHKMIQQEAKLQQAIESLGGRFPFEQSEEDRRMRSELAAAMAMNDPTSFSYTRAPGSGLRVPDFTHVDGNAISPQSLSPGVQSGGSGANSGGPGPYWTHKEEDEYRMEMGWGHLGMGIRRAETTHDFLPATLHFLPAFQSI